MRTSHRWVCTALAPALSGAMLMVSMPQGKFPGLIFFFFLPVLFAVRETTFLRGFLVGVTTGLVAGWLSTTALAAPAVIDDGSYAWNILGFGFYGIVLGLLAGVFAEFRDFSWRNAILFSVLGVLLELLTFLKLPTHVALSLYQSPSIVWIASITGIWGVSWLIWAAHATLMCSNRFKPAMVTLVLVAAGFAQWQSTQPFPSNPYRGDQRAIQVAALQSSNGDVDHLIELSRTGGARAEIVVWPELAISLFDAPEVLAFAREPGTGAVVTSLMDDATPPHNAAYLFDAAGQSEAYHKRQPFGAEAEEIQRGTKPVVVRDGIGLNICFDSCYPWVMRDTALAGAQLIALPTLDPVSPNGFIQVGHAAFTPFRAAELGLPILRGETTADSMIVDAHGRILVRAGIGTDEVIQASVAPGHITIYRRFGDWFLYLCGLSVIAILLAERRKSAGKPTVSTVQDT